MLASVFWRPVLVGVDATSASAHAARVGRDLATLAGVQAHLLHATPEAWTVPPAPHTFAVNPDALNEAACDAARAVVMQALAGQVPPDALDRLTVRPGRPATVLRDAARDLDAGLIVLGGKHHSALGRWVVGSTAHALARVLDIPLLVTVAATPIKRMLAAVDLSEAAGPTIHAAERFAELLGASLRILHVVEPIPVLPDTPLHLNEEELLDRTLDHLERYVWPLITLPEAVPAVRRGIAAETIAAEAADDGSDLVILGSHGKGWVDRILIGSVTERVLAALPTSVLVVPVTGHVDRRGTAARGRSAARAPR
jgi:nucleotide-binding universal stress UspA family protein